MLIVITVISILVIAGLAWLFNRITPFKICPICAGVSGTWLWILVGIYFGLLDAGSWLLVAAMAMGGSVVGIAYQLSAGGGSAYWRKKRLPLNRSPLLWKTLFIPAGLVAVYSIISLAVSPSNPSWWIVFVVTTIILVILALQNRKVAAPEGRASPHEMRREELKDKMKNCC